MCLFGLVMLAELIMATSNDITQLTIIPDPYANCIRHLQYTINNLLCPCYFKPSGIEEAIVGKK